MRASFVCQNARTQQVCERVVYARRTTAAAAAAASPYPSIGSGKVRTSECTETSCAGSYSRVEKKKIIINENRYCMKNSDLL